MAAVAARNWDDAITNLSKAIEQSKSPAWLLARSQAYMEKKELALATRDAEYAFCTAAERGNDKSRKQMIEAQYRRSVISFRMKRYADADVCAVWSQQLAKGVAVRSADITKDKIDANGFYHATAADVDPAMGKGKEKQNAAEEDENNGGRLGRVMSLLGSNDESKLPYDKDFKKAQAWRSTIIGFLERLPADDPARKVTVKLVPTKPSLETKIEEKDPEIEVAKAELAQAAAAAATHASKPQAANNGPFRSQIYQSDTSITVSLFMKFPSKDDITKVQIDIQPNLVGAFFLHGSSWNFHKLTTNIQIAISNVPRDPSTAYIVPFAAIIPDKSSYRVATMKIEFTLAKAHPGKWPDFGREELSKPDPSTLPKSTGTNTTSNSTIPTTALPSATVKATSRGPAYPTSAKSGPKDWDKLEDEDAQDEDSGDVDSFFKKLYKDATPDQQRAMMKSFQESNGTTLSTDWNSVSQGEVETKPPEGVEAKKWGA